MRKDSAEFLAAFAIGAALGAGIAWLATSPRRDPRRAVARTGLGRQRRAHRAARAYEGGAAAADELVDALRGEAVKLLRRASGEVVHAIVEKLRGAGAEAAGTRARGSTTW